MTFESELRDLLQLTDVDYKYGLTKEELFHEAIANDRGRVTPDGPDDQQKAFPTALGIDGPLVFYTDPSCTGRPVQDTFAVAWPETEDSVWWKKDFQKYDADAYEDLRKRVIEHLNEKRATLYVQDV